MFETFYHSLIQKIGSGAALALVTSLTVATSGATGYKLYASMQQSAEAQPAPQIRVEQTPDESFDGTSELAQATQNDQGVTAPKTPPSNVAAPSPTKSSGTTTPIALAKAIAPTPTTVVTNTSNSCVITVFGKNYDVQPLRTSHPGGNVFVCGTDMSAAYQSAHGSNPNKLALYATTLSLSQSGSGSTSNTNNIGSSSTDDENEIEDDEDQEENEEREHQFSNDDDENEDEDEDENEENNEDD